MIWIKKRQGGLEKKLIFIFGGWVGHKMSDIKKDCDLCDGEAVQGVKVLGVESWFCRDCCSTVTVLSPPKFPVKVYRYHGRGKMETSEWYDLTEKELGSGKYCIFACGIYFKDSIPKELWYEIDCGWVELYDIWNYECVEWWEWPQELKEIMYAKVPKSQRV
jgi:hypothetical protein